MLDSPSPEVQVLSRLSARDLRTSLGSNLKAISDESGLDPWIFGGQRMTEALLFHNRCEANEIDMWRIPFLQKLLEQKLTLYYHSEDTTYIDSLINSLVTN